MRRTFSSSLNGSLSALKVTFSGNQFCIHSRLLPSVQSSEESIEVILEKGMQSGQKIAFHGEADEVPNTVTMYTVFVLQQKEHPQFRRKGDYLFIEHSSSLSEALCGFQFTPTHLDSRQLLIKSEPGVVIKPDQYNGINDQGMPVTMECLQSTLQTRSWMNVKTLHNVSIEDEMHGKQQVAQEAYDKDEDMHRGAQRVQCAHEISTCTNF